MYERLSLLFPEPVRKGFHQLLDYSDVEVDHDAYVGFMFYIGACAALAMAAMIKVFGRGVPLFDYVCGIHFAVLFIVLFVLSEAALYSWLSLTVDSRGAFVEEILPDALTLMATNIKAGLTTDKAILLAARPEFGPLKKEIERVGRELMTGKELHDVLPGIAKRIRSKALEKSITMIVEGIMSGGALATLLNETAEDLRRQSEIRKKVRSSVTMYVIFIFLVVGIGAPVMFGISTFLVNMLGTTFGGQEMPDVAMSNVPISLTKVSVDIEFVSDFSLMSMITAAFFGSLLIGLVSKGKEQEGLRYLPIMLILSVSLFYIVRAALFSTIGATFGM